MLQTGHIAYRRRRGYRHPRDRFGRHQGQAILLAPAIVTSRRGCRLLQCSLLNFLSGVVLLSKVQFKRAHSVQLAFNIIYPRYRNPNTSLYLILVATVALMR